MNEINSTEVVDQLYHEIHWLAKKNFGSVSEFMRYQGKYPAYLSNIRANTKKTGKVSETTIQEMQKMIKTLKVKKRKYKGVVTPGMVQDIQRCLKQEYRFLKDFCKDRPEYSYMFMVQLKDKAGQRISPKIKTLLKLFDIYDKHFNNEKPKNKTKRAKVKNSK